MAPPLRSDRLHVGIDRLAAAPLGRCSDHSCDKLVLLDYNCNCGLGSGPTEASDPNRLGTTGPWVAVHFATRMRTRTNGRLAGLGDRTGSIAVTVWPSALPTPARASDGALPQLQSVVIVHRCRDSTSTRDRPLTRIVQVMARAAPTKFGTQSHNRGRSVERVKSV